MHVCVHKCVCLYLTKAMIVTYLKYYRKKSEVWEKYLNLWEISLCEDPYVKLSIPRAH